MDEDQARDIALRAVERMGGIAALAELYREGHESDPEYEFVVDDQRVFVRLRHDDTPATVYVGPYTFEIRGDQLVNITTA